MLVNLCADGVSEVSGLELECEVAPSARHRCDFPLPASQWANVVAAHSNTCGSAQVLNARAQQVPFMKLSVARQQTMKEQATRKAAVLKQILKDKATQQATLVKKRRAGENTTERPAKTSRQASSSARTT